MANDPFRGMWWLLSHHDEREAHHTIRFRLAGRQIAICARCLGLYPALLAVVMLEARLGRLDLPGRWFWVFVLVTPAVLDYGRARLFAPPGSNRTRLGTGFLAGLGLGFGFSDYFADSNPTYFWVLLAVLALLVPGLWWVGRQGPLDP